MIDASFVVNHQKKSRLNLFMCMHDVRFVRTHESSFIQSTLTVLVCLDIALFLRCYVHLVLEVDFKEDSTVL